MKTLKEALEGLFPESSKTSLREWVKQGRILVQGQVVYDMHKTIDEKEKITLSPRKKFARENVEILYEDRDIVVVEKPAGLLTVATAYQKELCLHQILKQRYYKAQVFPVHRLDRETSGILVFAYTEKAKEQLKSLFEVHDLHREYQAIVYGHPTPKNGLWESHLFEGTNHFVHVVEKGKLAITHYQTLASNKRYTLLSLKLETGRKHQIRVHTSTAGHPIVGDDKYGNKEESFERLYLHAHKLHFAHPITKKPLQFTSSHPLNLVTMRTSPLPVKTFRTTASKRIR